MHSLSSKTSLRLRLAFLVCASALVWPVLAQEQPQPAQPPPRDTFFTLLVKGGPVMIPLGIASIMALAFTFERALSLRRRKVIPENFLTGLKSVFDGKPDNVDKAALYCEASKTPVGHIFKSGLQHMNRGLEGVEKAIEDAGEREVDKLKRSLRGLSFIAYISPLLGLLGTVYGMIRAFRMSTEAGMGKAEVLASGIYEALVTTAAGLTIAIPVLLVYQYFNNRVDALVDEIDEIGIEFMQHVFNKPDAP